MKTKRLFTTTLATALCLGMMAPTTFASEISVEAPTNVRVNEAIEERAGSTVSGTISRSAPFYYQGSFNVTCIFNITYNNLSGELYSASISSNYSNSKYTIKPSIVSKKVLSASSWELGIELRMYSGNDYKGSTSVFMTI